ncbi:AMP-binding protein [Chromobacterium alkanivorans]|uniref:AMP-binding protein n=1 Tax=Chromobacterium alkanivorans TaxID=1071719 RepID=UPI001967FF79|nr:AMP-binding protein [Chromobacterium alkanivorans]MBN3003488.1 AMP-binding protein [Chromobacterium alkanivorans]
MSGLIPQAPRGEAVDLINAIALRRCDDERHVIRFRQDDEVRVWTLAELDRKAARVARRLRALGLRPRDRIGVMSLNHIEFVLLDLAILKLGGVTAGFEAGRYRPEQIVDIYGLKALFAEGIASGGAFFDIAEIQAWAEGAETEAAEPPMHAGYDAADIFAIKFTSGSTGAPKGLEATVASANSSINDTQTLFAHRDGDNLLVFLRLVLLQQRYWIYSALVYGHDLTLSNLEQALDMASACAPTVVMGVPGFYEELRGRLLSRHGDSAAAERGAQIQAALGGRVRYLWTGSAPASRDVLEFFNHAGVPLYEGYGSNEACIVAKNHPGAFRLGSVGQVLPGKSVRFDQDGILIVASRHPVNCRYTWCDPGINEKSFLPSAEVKTWDLGHLDADGFLYIHGRIDDIVTVTNGRNVLVRPIEEGLRQHPHIREGVLYGTGKPFVTAILSPDLAAADAEALRRHVATMNQRLFQEERILAVVIAEEPFSIENGLLSSQFKPKRKLIYQRYAAQLDEIYARHARTPEAFSEAAAYVRDCRTPQPSLNRDPA